MLFFFAITRGFWCYFTRPCKITRFGVILHEIITTLISSRGSSSAVSQHSYMTVGNRDVVVLAVPVPTNVEIGLNSYVITSGTGIK